MTFEEWWEQNCKRPSSCQVLCEDAWQAAQAEMDGLAIESIKIAAKLRLVQMQEEQLRNALNRSASVLEHNGILWGYEGTDKLLSIGDALVHVFAQLKLSNKQNEMLRTERDELRRQVTHLQKCLSDHRGCKDPAHVPMDARAALGEPAQVED